MDNVYYNPGCALMLYKPHLAKKVLQYLNGRQQPVEFHLLCCGHDPKVPRGARIINTCPGCDRRFGSLYEGVSTISLWEVLADDVDFPFPDHSGLCVSVHDACPVRDKPQVHQAIRTLLRRMNIEIRECAAHGKHSVCCGDSVYDDEQGVPLEKVHEAMCRRASSMPYDDVCVYCGSCIKSMHIGGKKPRYIVDLLFDEPTDPQVYDTELWHKELDAYSDRH
ncbi:MAG: (Fe-S)-binding protein [Deltaproteobacteria bacterium]|jgi:Fe-S oxidoreductase|nr:(Fe-S)-binding protein [Deltaproteobacteria bacterium]